MSDLRYTIKRGIQPPPPIDSVSVDKPSELKIALDNRTFEIQMFWQRSNYFLVLITAIGVAVFTVKDTLLATILSSFGSLSSYYWYKTNLGSKFWQESWEVEVVNLAAREKIASFERSAADIQIQVKKSLEQSWQSGSKNRVHRYLDQKITEKPSVSYYMILLSVASTVLWSVVTLVLFMQLVGSQDVALPRLRDVLMALVIGLLHLFR